ncbi:acyltransferase domain-containing protein [Kitasatospora sp. NBC_01250]|uniref:acyltransferase domain-containing protein n=1 Tax=Kitasatospora sp. NBC_01250 TaxID=2903571 RepID=UPI002E37B07B|nr:acyltransferase domain-containing protein [Kitasatospora sp. NBC_01250]
MGALGQLLRADQGLTRWWDRQAPQDAWPTGVRLPEAGQLPGRLLDLTVPHEDINPLLAACALTAGEPVAGRLVERCAARLVREIGTVGRPAPEPPPLPPLPPGLAAFGRWFPVLVHLTALPHTRAYHRQRGIPVEVSRHTLADLGRTMALHRRRHGTGGLLHPHWFAHHVRGELYQLGRLQFERTRLGGRCGQSVAAAGLPYGPGTPSLAIHIPDHLGPLTPAACEDALARARAFFPRHFPEQPLTVATCHSWLLDPQLRGYLPAGANLLRFQDRFHPCYEQTEPDDTAPLVYVFGTPDPPLDALPASTTLERALVDHLRAGGHWYGGNGWLEL